MNVFDCAIKIEEETKSYYEGLEAEATNPEMKNLFSMLVAAEDEHEENLRRLRDRAAADQRLDGLNGAVCSFKPHLTQRELLEETEKDPDLYIFAVKKEEEDIRFYEELAGLAVNDATRSCLMMLADEERRHLETVENIYSFVEAPKNYLESGEFSNLKTL
ncbi:MAG TPA: ferritin [Geobacter sp.]|nr:ferritin [Geobacter sp.]